MSTRPPHRPRVAVRRVVRTVVVHGEGNVLLIRARDTRPCRHSGTAGNFRTAAWTSARVQLESALTVRVDEVRPSFAAGQPDEYERQDHSLFAWAEPAWVESAHAQFYPGTLPRYLDRHLHREPIIEPFEWWPPPDRKSRC